MKVDWILFDIDNTLLDFDAASKLALEKAFDNFDIPFNDSHYKIYKRINAENWHQLEKGIINALTLRHRRFDLLFEALELRPTTGDEFNAYYLEQLIKHSKFFDNVPRMLAQLKKKYKLSVITNGLKEVQRSRLNHLDLSRYFDSIIVSDEIGHAKPDKAYFDHVFSTIPKAPAPENTLVVGDNFHSDIKGGSDYGCLTCWVHLEKEDPGELEPDYTIRHISEFSQVIDYEKI
jgi:YjjG family noncanonical pyrimidine nucleotidase